MDYQKMDANLAMALNSTRSPETEPLLVFVHTFHPPSPDETAFLESVGITGVNPTQRVFTAALSTEAVEALSSQPWINYLELSRKLQLYDGGLNSSNFSFF